MALPDFSACVRAKEKLAARTTAPRCHPRLNIKLTRGTLKDLDPEVDAADIVLFMEVLHWAVAQGMSIPAVIRRLWGLTRRALYIEFPWSIDEPSIPPHTQPPPPNYSAHPIFPQSSPPFP